MGFRPIGYDAPEGTGLKSLVTHGGIVIDTMGLGKTFLSLLFVNYLASYRKTSLHKPPNGVVLNQWLKAITLLLPRFGDKSLLHGGKKTFPV